MPVDPMIARGIQPIDVSNTLAQIAMLRQRDQALADDRAQTAALQQQIQAKQQAAAEHEQALVEAISRNDWATVARLDPEVAREIRAQHEAEQGGAEGVAGVGYGNVNPGDFTPESLALFDRTRNFGDLVRQYAPIAPVVVNTPGYGVGVVDRRTGQPIAQLTTPEQEAAARATAANAETGAKAAADRQAGIEKKIADMGNADRLLDLASPLVLVATGSGAGAAADKVASVFGYSPAGADAIAGLKTIQAQLMLAAPRMEGPQSDRDVQLYREAAANLGDPTVPRSQKMAAIRTIRDIHKRYSRGNATAAPAAQSQPAQVQPKSYKHPSGATVEIISE